MRRDDHDRHPSQPDDFEDHEQRPILTLLSDVPKQEVDFLWRPYLPLGKLCILDGRQGLGKTWIALHVAAAISAGRPFYGDEEQRDPASVIYMTLEDGVADTLRPRLEALGADLNRVLTLDGYCQGRERGLFTLDQGHVLGSAIVETRARLVVVDPFLGYMPRGHHHAEGARRVMTGLAILAERYDCTILGIRHLTKAGSYRGPVEIDAACRSVLHVGVDESGIRVMAHRKANLTGAGASLAFDLCDGQLNWLGESSLTADALMAAKRGQPRRREAGEFLLDLLAEGPLPAQQVEHMAFAEGISRSTLYRAKEALRVESYQRERHWYWRLPSAGSGTQQGVEYLSESNEETAPAIGGHQT